ncbi:hypothetical protein BDV33DRAFT_185425 [Aspergillus novoparasiticus]|uniref:Uncharacterized protein n=1 Tax=Aspergillus novoparasiticus TaxID=986946 RepID=A0A5N6E769_9EURO|nr:hypothetical protein BDV33DRAFT_185425 [Aspergillus novoparasiticus]
MGRQTSPMVPPIVCPRASLHPMGMTNRLTSLFHLHRVRLLVHPMCLMEMSGPVTLLALSQGSLPTCQTQETAICLIGPRHLLIPPCLRLSPPSLAGARAPILPLQRSAMCQQMHPCQLKAASAVAASREHMTFGF